jgi:hypothetical protein
MIVVLLDRDDCMSRTDTSPLLCDWLAQRTGVGLATVDHPCESWGAHVDAQRGARHVLHAGVSHEPFWKTTRFG